MHEVKEYTHTHSLYGYYSQNYMYICVYTIDVLLKGKYVLVVEGDGYLVVFWNLKRRCTHL